MTINEDIRDKEIRVISDENEQLGIMAVGKALDLATEKQLDLVKIAPQAEPPVCKIMNYSKYRFEAIKREKEARKNQKVITVKEVQVSVNIGENDLNIKARNAVRFLNDGEKVKVALRFKGRQLAHSELGYELMERFFKKLEEAGTIEKKANLDGRNMIMIVKPKE